MVKNYCWLICLFTLLFVSCSEDEVLNTTVGKDNVRITAQIQADKTASRADIGIDGKGNFEEGDEITLKYNYNLHHLILKDGQWTPGLSWSEIGSEATFSAFYPMVTTTGSFFHVVELDQSIDNNFEKSDLLYAPSATVKEGDPVNLNFNHLMSCVTLVLKSNVYTDEELQKAEIKISALNKVKVESDGTVGFAKVHNNIPKIKFRFKEGTTFQAIICPQEFYDYGVDGWINITIKGKTYTVKSSPAGLNNIKSGQNITLTYSFNEKKPDTTWGGKTYWVYGLEDTPTVDNSAWTKLPSTILKQLIWKPSYNWYDCDKRDLLSSAYSDQNLCWAATASNMIHWWMDRNSDLVGEYCKENNIPVAYNDHLQSEVFQVFKDSFTDDGSYIEQGLNWYFLGKYQQPGDGAGITDRSKGAYFKKVLNTVSDMTINRQIGSLDSFSEILKSAFENKQAIGFSVYMSGFGGASHAMTIWGANFDENGKVRQIYYCDNNDGYDVYDKPHLIAANVAGDGGVTRLQGSAIVEKYTMVITSVTLLDLKRDELRAYLKK